MFTNCEAEFVGACPVCNEDAGILTIGGVRYGYCTDHQLAWWVSMLPAGADSHTTEADLQIFARLTLIDLDPAFYAVN